MIVDSIGEVERYYGVHSGIRVCLSLLKSKPRELLENGKHIVNDDDFFIVSEYKTKDVKECYLEGHKKYIDVQHVISGEEMVGYSQLRQQKVLKKYSNADDVELYLGKANYIKLNPDNFAIFFPGDLHMPAVKSGVDLVKKIVFKVKV